MTRTTAGISVSALLALFASAVAEAQERPLTTRPEREETVRVTVSGDVVLDSVWRSRELTAFTNTAVPYAPPGAPSVSENTFEGFAAVRFDVDLSDEISAVVEIGTRRVDGGAIVRWGSSTSPPVDLREAAVLLNDFLISDLRVRIGIADWSFDVRGRGAAFAFDPRHSQTIARNLQQLGGNIALRESGDARLAMAATPNELEPVGLRLSYTRSNLSFDWVVLPAVIEGGSPSADESMYGVDAMYRLDDKGSRFGVMGMFSHLQGADGSHGTIFTAGGGFDLRNFFTAGLEFYAEGYLQQGRAGENPAGEGVRARGRAAQVGAEYHAKTGEDVWFGVNLTWFSGDDSTGAGNRVDDRFAGYEGVRDLMILEDQYYGFDWDSNLLALKVTAGTTLTVGGKNTLDLRLIAGVAHAAAPVGFTGSTATSRKLGDEIDFTARWHLNAQASLVLGAGYLFSSSILKDAMEAVGYAADRAENNGWVVSLGADVRF